MSTQPPKRSRKKKDRTLKVLNTIKNKRRKAMKEAIRTGKSIKIRISDPKKEHKYEVIEP